MSDEHIIEVEGQAACKVKVMPDVEGQGMKIKVEPVGDRQTFKVRTDPAEVEGQSARLTFEVEGSPSG
jgi:hypothetical protein